MSDVLPRVTIIVAARPEEVAPKAVDAARAFDYPADKLEILVARGKQPSVQRNAAMRAARGDLIYFLDDDSVAPPGNLRRAAPYFGDAKVQIVGGPNLCPPDAPELEQVFALVLGSWLAFGPSRARYTPVGQTRPAGEKELILCNMMARRQAMLDLGGFNEALYPNEENALMDDFQKRGDRLLYDPGFIVHRHPRRSVKAFIKMLMTYGRGRAEQFRINPTLGSALNFVPPLFCVYVAALAVLWVIRLMGSADRIALWATLPLAFYGLVVLAQTVALVGQGGVRRSLGALPFLVLSHLFYGVGFWRGLFTKLKSPGDGAPPPPVTIQKVT